MLTQTSRERVPQDWAKTQNHLGNALQTLGERESGTMHLEEALAAYRAALTERPRERVPLDWAMTQNNLGNALLRLGERDSGVERLTEAVSTYRAALAVRTRERMPLDWATTQTNLGAALHRLGERDERYRPPHGGHFHLIALRLRYEPASACRWIGPRLKTTSALRS